MSKRFTIVTAALVAFLVGTIMAGGIDRSTISAGAPKRDQGRIGPSPRSAGAAVPTTGVNFADVVERINPAVVNIDATSRGGEPRGSNDRGDRNRATPPRASSIGFAVPINGASAILPQLRAQGHVTRGYVGVALREVDRDLQQSLGLSVSRGALVQDVTAASPAARAGIQPYDVIVALDGVAIERSMVLMEINRKPIESAADYRRVAGAAHPGDVLTLYVYVPDAAQRKLLTVRVDDR
jgi:S1-C subfamily serine protease